MQLPHSLFHYYEGSRKPFLSMSELDEKEFSGLMNELSATNTIENRFDEEGKRQFYQFFRPYTEQRLREIFIEKGGQPKLTAPRYMTLGPTAWFNSWYLKPKVIEIPLVEIPTDSVSFTYPDSMMSLLLAEDRYEPFAKFKQPYHGEIFRLEDLQMLVSKYGLPDESNAENLESATRLLEPLEPYINSPD